MPEQITKYPDITLQVLKSAGAVCGQGAEQKILKQCPKERFCSLPGGEMCIYGLADISQMTQITVREIADVIAPLSGQRTEGSAFVSLFEVIILAAVFIAGLGFGRLRKSPGSGGS